MSPSAVESCPRRGTFGDRGTREASSRLPLGEERANILLVACCYQEGSAAPTRPPKSLLGFTQMRYSATPCLSVRKQRRALHAENTKSTHCLGPRQRDENTIA